MHRRSEPRSRPILNPTLGALALILVATVACAAETEAGKRPSESLFVAQVVVLLITGRLLGEIMQRIGQPTVVGQLLAGILLGPSVFGALWPEGQHFLFPPGNAPQKALLDGVAQLGVLFLLMLTGMETDMALVKRVGRSAVAVSLTGVAVPFVCGVLLGEFVVPDSMLPDPEKRLVTSLFLGTALSISSIKIVAMVVREMNFMRRDLGQVIVASAIIDDTIGWIIVALIFGLARPGGLDWRSLGITVGSTALFLVVSYTIGRRIVAALIRWANDRLVSELPVITIVLCIMGLMAITTDLIGVNTVLGAFVAGVLIGESPLLTDHIEEQLRGLIVALFAPIFFALAGLGTDLTILKQPALLGFAALLILAASLGKFGGAFLGGSIGGLKRNESLALALGMNARGSTEVIVATLGLSVGALTHNLFSMIVAMAVLTTMVMPPTLRWALGRLPISEAEGKRLAQEAYDEHGFVAGLERLLVDADGSASGRLASRLAGLLGGPRGLPITVMQPGAKPTGEADATVEVAAGAATGNGAADNAAAEAPPVDVTRQEPTTSHGEALTAEIRKGYDLLVVGLEPVRAEGGQLGPVVQEAMDAFPGPRLVVSAASQNGSADAPSFRRVVVPVKGTEASRRAAELACALAQSGRLAVHVLYTIDPAGVDEGSALAIGSASRRLGREVMSDIGRIAERYDVVISRHTRVSDRPDQAIIRQAARVGADLIMMGVDERPGDSLIFGVTADGLLKQSTVSLALLTSAPGTGAREQKTASDGQK